MPETELPFPEETLESFCHLLDLGTDGIDRLCEGLLQSGPILASPRRRAELIREAVGEMPDVEILDLILDHSIDFLLFHRLQVEEDLELEVEDAARVVYGVAKELLEEIPRKRFPEKYVSKWTQLEQNLLNLIELNVLRIEAKAFRLLSDRPNRVQSMCLYSDERPIFNNDGTEIEAKTLVNVLRLQSHNGPDTTVTYFSMDPDDLDELAEWIDRARTKNKSIIEQNEKNGQKTLRLDRENGSLEVEVNTNA